MVLRPKIYRSIRWKASVPETPFGGVKESGNGKEGGAEGLSRYTTVKNVSHRMMVDRA